MKPHFDLTDENFNTSNAPLCVVRHAMGERQILEPLLNFDLISQKFRTHRVGDKLNDAFLLILAGYPSLYLLNNHLRPDLVLAQACRRDQLAEQSNVSRVLDAFDDKSLPLIQDISWQFWQAHTQFMDHDWRKNWLSI